MLEPAYPYHLHTSGISCHAVNQGPVHGRRQRYRRSGRGRWRDTRASDERGKSDDPETSL